MAISKIASAGITADFDNTLTAADIAANAIGSSEIADDAVGTDQLSNAVAISTSGAITTTGAFTSVGIDDNASGATAITIDSDEKVGIGTATPAKQLEVSSAIPTFRLNSTDSSGTSGDILGEISFKSADTHRGGDPAAAIRAVVGGTSGEKTDLVFMTGENGNAASEKMRINESGQICIGSDQSTAVAALYVRTSHATQYAAHIENTHGEKGHALHVASNGNENDEYIIKCTNAASQTVLCATGIGRVGMGTSSPDYPVVMYDASNAWFKINCGNSSGASGILFANNLSHYWHMYLPNQDDDFRIYDAENNNGVYLQQDQGSWSSHSDERIKTSISIIDNAVDKLNTLRAFNFKWKYGSEKSRNKLRIGLSAQEVNEVFPEVVNSYPLEDFKIIDHPVVEGEKQSEKQWGLRSVELVPVLVKAIQELSAKIDALETKVTALENA